jgi:hypothetical protein
LVIYNMVETIAHARTLASWIEKGDLSPERLVAALLQVMAACAVGFERVGFVHNDLHDDNVMVRILDAPVTCVYTLRGKRFYLVTDVLVTLIDFGRSRIQVPLPESETDAEEDLGSPWIVSSDGRFFFTGYTWLRVGKSNTSPSVLFDIVNLLSFSYASAQGHPELRSVIASMVEPLYGDMTETFFLTTEESPLVLPFDRDVDMREWIEFVGRLPSAKQVYFERYNARRHPPLFSCESGSAVCARPVSKA